jgi:hypothetical protein
MKNYQVFGVLIWMMFALICTQIDQPADTTPGVEPLRSNMPFSTEQTAQQDTLKQFP